MTIGVLLISLDLTFDPSASWTVAAVSQVAYAWLAIVTLIGLFHAALSTEHRSVRYLSDSAYWLYLAHLPLVILGQTWIRNWDLPATVKFIGLTAFTTAFLLGTYEFAVRYTAVGSLLNGKRTRAAS